MEQLVSPSWINSIEIYHPSLPKEHPNWEWESWPSAETRFGAIQPQARENTRRNVMWYSTKSTHLHTWGNSYVSWVMKCVWDFCKKYRHYTSDENVQYHLNLSHTKKHQLLQDGNAIKPSKWVVSSIFFFLSSVSLPPHQHCSPQMI